MIRKHRGRCLLLAGLLILAGCQAGKRVGPSVQPAWPSVDEMAGPPTFLRVALSADRPEQTLSCTGPWTLSFGLGDPSAVEMHAGQKVVVRADQGRVVIEAIDGHLGLSASKQGQGLVFAPLDLNDRILWDGRPWRGSMLVETLSSDGTTLTVMNLVELEDYLSGVVPMEMGRGRLPAELAALAAQAVAARTYAVARLRSRRTDRFDLYSDIRDQVYGGAAVEDSLCSLAVAHTAGIVLCRRSDLTLADAFYHSTCAGHTATSARVWPVADDPLLQGVNDRRRGGRSWCEDSRYYTWRERWSWKELERILAGTLPAYLDYVARTARASWAADAFMPTRIGVDGRDPGDLLDVLIKSRTPEGRVAVLEIITRAGRYRVRGDQTRRVLRPAAGSPLILRSAWFDLEVAKGHEIMASGRGWGHGIGMCQMGALARARHGQSVQEILAHYYPESVLTRLTGEVLP
jgi:stage II sporulation protein D